MTAPSLLDELKGIVRLAEKATPGPFVVDGYGDVTANGEDVARIASDGYSAYHDAHLFADAANFIRAHHAELADMAKRLEAAERDAARWRFFCDNIGGGYGDGYTEPQEQYASLEWQQGPWIYDGSNGGRGRADTFPGWSAIIDRMMEEEKLALKELDEPIDVATQEGEE